MRKIVLRGLIIFIFFEISFRIVIDPLYFYQVDTFTIDKSGYNFKRLYLQKEKDLNDTIDYLFFGSSRIPAAIDVNVIHNLNKDVLAVNAGRGYLTGAINYWALQKRIKENPAYLENTIVLTELQGTGKFIYSDKFDESVFEIREEFPHLFLPHLNVKLLINFITRANYNSAIKAKMAALYSFSLYRAIPFFRDKLQELVRSDNIEEELVAGEGGIKTDKVSIEMAREIVSAIAKERIEIQETMQPFSEEDLDESMIAAIHQLIVENGGQLVLLDMPLHSVQKAIYETDLNINNRNTFTTWARKKGIPILSLNNFSYSEDEFPDYGHLGSHRRTEFTEKLYGELEEL